MGEVRRTEMMNTYEMDSGYPDSVNSSPRSRETDWEPGDTAGGSRFRLMCSYGGKILQRSHDNQLSYVGGDTRILAVDRNIRFAAMNAKLSSLWGPGVSFKYQLPNEELDALVSVTNDEDMENMMAEYERLQKMGYRFSRLRLFVFSNKPDGVSAQGNLGSLMEESKQENWFVDALNVGPVSRPETVQQGNWMNNAPNYSSGLEGIGIKCDRSSSQKSYGADQMNSKEQEIYRGRELQRPEGQSATSSPIDPISASARIITPAASQTEMSINLGHGLEQDSNLAANPKPIDSNRVLKNEDLKNADRTNIQKQEHYTSEFSVVTSSLINERAHKQPQLQVPVHEFQKLQLGQPQDPIARPVDDIANLNISDMSRPNPKLDQPYMPQQRQYQQIPSQSEYYMHDQGPQFVPQNYWQMQEPHGDQQSAYHPVYFMHAGSPMTTVPSMGQPAPGSGGYYNPVQRVTPPVQFYSPEAAPLSNPMTTARAAGAVQRQAGSDSTEPYGAPIQIPAPVPKGPYTAVQTGPLVSDARVMYRPTGPVPLPHTDPYSYPNVMYEPSSRQVYYTQASPAQNPQYQSMNPDM